MTCLCAVTSHQISSSFADSPSHGETITRRGDCCDGALTLTLSRSGNWRDPTLSSRIFSGWPPYSWRFLALSSPTHRGHRGYGDLTVRQRSDLYARIHTFPSLSKKSAGSSRFCNVPRTFLSIRKDIQHFTVKNGQLFNGF